MQNELRTLIARHCVTVAMKTEGLASMLAPLREGRIGPPGAIGCAIDLTREIRGSGGTIGFDEIFMKATQLGVALNKLASSMEEGSGAAEAVQWLDALIDAANHLTPERSRLFNLDLTTALHS